MNISSIPQMQRLRNQNQIFYRILSLLRGVKKGKNGNGYLCLCPVHDDHQPSLSLSLTDDGKILLHCFAGCSTEDICSVLGVSLADLSPTAQNEPKQAPPPTYIYRDPEGRALFGVIRTPEKNFPQCRPDGNGGWWYGLGGVQPVLYRLPELILAIRQQGETVFLVEGEKDADNLAALGLTATTNPMGAGKWRSWHADFLVGAKVIILPDNDEPGREHARQVARSLAGKAASVKVLELPGLPEKGDVSDWLAAGGTKEKLFRLATAAPALNANTTEGKTITYVCMSEVEPEEVCWLWEPYVPFGKITLLEGDPAAGKTWVALAVAAAVSTGAPFPDPETGRCIYRRKPGNVIYLSAEDGLADTLRPRLDMLEANVKNIYVVTGTRDQDEDSLFSFDDLDLLDHLTGNLETALVVVDPLQAYLGAGVDMHRANETRPVLAKLAALAEKRKCAVLILRHLSKAAAVKNIYRGMGSIDFTAAARSVLLAGLNPENPKERAIIQLKSSLAPNGPSMGYELKGGFFWTGISELTASTILGSDCRMESEKTKLQETKDWLAEILKNGPIKKRDIEELARDEDIKPSTLRRAKKELGVISVKPEDEGKNPPWVWKFPGNNSQDEGDQDDQDVEIP
jgi:putative DNA primase/helicase